MLDVLSVIIVLAVLYAIVSVPVGIFNLKVFQAVHGTKCTGLSILKAFAPLYNITFARKLAYGKSTVFNVMLLICLLLFVFRVVSIALVSLVPVLVVYSSLVMIACIAIYCILYIINCVDFCRMFNCGLIVTLCGGGAYRLLYAVHPGPWILQERGGYCQWEIWGLERGLTALLQARKRSCHIRISMCPGSGRK